MGLKEVKTLLDKLYLVKLGEHIMITNTSQENPATSEEEQAYAVKLFHMSDSNNPCDYDEQADRLQLTASSQAQLRQLIETGETAHFRGEICKKCGARAVVNCQLVVSDHGEED